MDHSTTGLPTIIVVVKSSFISVFVTVVDKYIMVCICILYNCYSPANSLHSKRPLDATGVEANEKSEKKIKKENKQKKCVIRNKGNRLQIIMSCLSANDMCIIML